MQDWMNKLAETFLDVVFSVSDGRHQHPEDPALAELTGPGAASIYVSLTNLGPRTMFCFDIRRLSYV